MTRREAREQALLLVFQMSFQNLPVVELAELTVENKDGEENGELDGYTVELAGAVQKNMQEIDSIIEKHSTKWKPNRLPKVSLAVLRLAIAEIEYMENVPQSVVVNEAVELAKIYGDDEDPSYINGVLGGYLRKRETPNE